MSQPVRVRLASRDDIAAIVRLINEAYVVEAHFVSGDRTNPATVWRLLDSGVFLVVDTTAPVGPPAGVAGGLARSSADGAESRALDGCIYVERMDPDRAYFGMLAVAPAVQGRGIARTLIEAAEARARQEGAGAMDIRVVSLRTELFPFYRRFGYVEVEIEPYSEPRALQPFHFVRMRKPL